MLHGGKRVQRQALVNRGGSRKGWHLSGDDYALAGQGSDFSQYQRSASRPRPAQVDRGGHC